MNYPSPQRIFPVKPVKSLKKLIPLFSLSLIMLLSLGSTSHVYSDQATIEDVIITNTAEDLIVYCTVRGAFNAEMYRAVLNGVLTTFTFNFELYQKKSFMFDKKLSAVILNRSIKYNTLKNEFIIKMDEDKNEPIVMKEFFKAKKLLTEVNGIKIANLKPIGKKSGILCSY